MRVKIILLIAFLVFLTGCSKESVNEPSVIKPVEISAPEFDFTPIPVTPENFMSRMAFLDVEISKTESSGIGYPDCIYEGVNNEVYGSLITYSTEDAAKDWFNQLKLGFGDFTIGVEDVINEDDLFTVKTDEYFVGIRKIGKEVLTISAGQRVEEAYLVFFSLE